ncbi:TPM domain-containing protein [Cellulophaga baltica]|uniref:TPM domain-containing protein n=1 Tax=Cellulophaga baltica TaxID=76594 RepID=UPI0024943803|nr:TPM domain-containing protein [Cellulophaga baltica]
MTDNAKILSTNEVKELTVILSKFEKETTNQIVVLTINSLEQEPIEYYALKTFETNKIGHIGKDNGILLLISKEDKKIRIEVGYGLEEYITDWLSSRIVSEHIVPEFKKGNYYKGINNALKRITDTLENVSENDSNRTLRKNKIHISAKIASFIFCSLLGYFGGTFFYVIYKFYTGIFVSFFKGELSLLFFPIEIIKYVLYVFFTIPFVLFPILMLIHTLFDYDIYQLSFVFEDITYLFYFLTIFFLLTTIIAIIRIIYNKDSFGFSFFMNKNYVLGPLFTNGSGNSSSTYSSSGNSYSSSSSSSSGFSGNGGRSGGGGASGSW